MIGEILLKLRNSGIHFFDRLAIYYVSDMSNLKTQYWKGYRRKRIFTLFGLSFWIRQSKGHSPKTLENVDGYYFKVNYIYELYDKMPIKMIDKKNGIETKCFVKKVDKKNKTVECELFDYQHNTSFNRLFYFNEYYFYILNSIKRS